MTCFVLSNETSEAMSRPEEIQKNDWALIYRDAMSGNRSGFWLISPMDKRHGTNAPLGGAILAALMFLLEHEDESFWQNIIATANKTSVDKFGGPMFGDLGKPTKLN